jgi:hypothetical protein
MFYGLDEMERNHQPVAPPRLRWLHRGVVLLVTILLFGGLFVGVQFFE